MEKQVSIQLISGETDTVTVRKLALGDYAELLRAVKKLPKEITRFIDDTDTKDLKGLDFKEFVPNLLPMLADGVDELCAVLAVPTDKDAAYFEKQVDLPDALDVLVAALELNDYKRVMAAVKKLTARKTPASPKPEQTPEAAEAPATEPKTT